MPWRLEATSAVRIASSCEPITVIGRAPIGLRRTILFSLANANIYLGRAEDALEALDRHRALRAEDRSTQNAATVEFNRLVAQIAIGGRRPNADVHARLVADAEAVVA